MTEVPYLNTLVVCTFVGQCDHCQMSILTMLLIQYQVLKIAWHGRSCFGLYKLL